MHPDAAMFREKMTLRVTSVRVKIVASLSNNFCAIGAISGLHTWTMPTRRVQRAAKDGEGTVLQKMTHRAHSACAGLNVVVDERAKRHHLNKWRVKEIVQ